MNTPQVLLRWMSCIGHTHTHANAYAVCAAVYLHKRCWKQDGIEFTGLIKCAMALWLPNHEQFLDFQRLKNNQSLSLPCCFFLSLLFSLSCTHRYTYPPHTCHWGPLAPLVRFYLAFRLRHKGPPVTRGTVTVCRCLPSPPVNGKLNNTRYCTRNTVWSKACVCTYRAAAQHPCSVGSTSHD